jgi:endonuclease YncB( thermonuclease family)
MSNTLALRTYQKLLNDISRLYETARQSQVRFAWETGMRIVQVEQKGDIRAEYGTDLIPKLSEELTRKYGNGFSTTNLEDMRRFYLANRISRPGGNLGWTVHLALARVSDLKKRQALEQRAIKGRLKKEEVRQLVRDTVGTNGKPAKALPPLVRPTELKLGTYRYGDGGRRTETKRETSDVTSPSPSLVSVLDLGFFVSHSITKKQGATVTITDTPSYTYSATVERIVDGDTLWCFIDLGFNITVREKLRFRGINCPELGTPVGDKAKKFVEKLLPAGSMIVIHSEKTRTEKWGRFLADIFYLKPDSAAGEIIEDGTYLNQQLLDEGYAVRMEE